MTTVRVPLPEHLRKILPDAPAVPTEPRDAATMVVVRDGAEGIEAFFMRRHSGMALWAGMYVFPGGGVHPSDYDEVPWIGPPPAEWAERLGCDEDRARALVVAAVRETFEETQILLAGPDEHTVVADTDDPGLAEARERLDRHEVSLGEFLRKRGWSIRADLIGAWARWITPNIQPRRYDTFFFVATLPAGQVVGSISREADRATWAPLSQVLAACEAGDAQMMPPTVAVCRSVARHDAGSLLEASRERPLAPVEPQVLLIDGEYYLETKDGSSDD